MLLAEGAEGGGGGKGVDRAPKLRRVAVAAAVADHDPLQACRLIRTRAEAQFVGVRQVTSCPSID